MKTTVVAQQKGGVGKTSTLVHLALDALERGKKVAVIDLDTQGNASYSLQAYQSGLTASAMFKDVSSTPWAEIAGEGEEDTARLVLIASDAGLADMEKTSLAEAGTHFKEAIRLLALQGFDLCLIDTPPSLGNCLAAALYAADYVLSPIELEVYSIQGIKKMNAAIANMRKANPGLIFLGMVPSKVDGRNPRHKEHLDKLQAAYPQLMIPATIGLRSSIADALANGVPVWQIKKTAARKAAKEVRALAQYVYEKMEIA
ncbi:MULTISPECIES: ParA family protein [Azotobacter]|uniref:IncC partitioning protein, long form, ParA like n=1 Tax=Azotobacter chroococcum NCIMB 8003 TaxID=1328314 RepID=A0A0C4WS52_9GAMM|nr:MULTISPECIES: ParA family protein [Azotobacter]AJE23489.1 IncC partitioning protein, long form, ParA like [Azotobacter chroococcum NCIMB 8003]MDV7210073.1 ParA family protein [Azotobacter beijerinckii]